MVGIKEIESLTVRWLLKGQNALYLEPDIILLDQIPVLVKMVNSGDNKPRSQDRSVPYLI
ncbi:MAG: hypothetical protein ACTSRK_11070 [Promethearchaeota archaeon]